MIGFAGFRASLLAGAAVVLLTPQAFAADFTVNPGATDTGGKTVFGPNLGTIGAGGKLTPAAGTVAITWSLNTNTTAAVTINNSGTIQGSGSSRGIGTSSNAAGAARSFNFDNLTATSVLASAGNDAFQINNDIGTGAINVNNFGTIKATGTGGSNGQALDFNAITTTTGTVTITNQVGGVIQAADADGIRPGNRATINNSGQIIANWVTGANGNDSNNDAIDFQDVGKGGTINNFSTGSITGARNAITGKDAIIVNNSGTITGVDGSGLNIDTTTASGITVVVNNAGGVITGNAVHADGDAIDVDYLVNITNAGTIRAVGIDPVAAASLNEALAIGGGTVTNNAGGLIISDERAITVDDSDHGNAFGATSIDNAGTITGTNGQAIAITSISGDTLTNRAGGVINGSVVMGNGVDTINLYGGSALNGALNGGGGSDTIHLLGSGNGTLANVSGVEVLKVDSGRWAVNGNQTYASGVTVATGATMLVNGALGGDVVNNGTVRVDNATVSFTGTFQNNGAYISDPSTQTFNNLSVGANGYIQAGAGDVFKVGGNFTNASTKNQLWYTREATLELIGADQTNHWIDVLGADNGKTARNQDFSWGELNIDGGNLITFKNGTALCNRGWYVADLIGALISGSSIANITGFNGLTVYYDAYQTDNAYLGGLTYALAGGGQLVADVPEPMTWILFLSGLGLLGGFVRRRRVQAVAG
ncbi:MAG: PEP-CTERM sorting domain-containing protein [Alphaproteobacteria bacterium]|nr:PEP-CTERM sorting domain-containing protein [Alphaproteobacteria bacterium]